MKFIDVEQNSEEWYELRCGKITSSSMSKIMANYGKSFGDPAKQYAISIALERITGKYTPSNYSNEHMLRGHEEEPLARMKYEEDYFCDIENGGFFDLGDIGCSPDGLVCGEGLIEIKSALPHIHFSRISKAKYDSAYKWQLAANLKFTQREWIDFISYCSSYPEDKNLFVYRCTKKEFEEEFKMIDKRIDQFKTLIEECENKILNSKYYVEANNG